jgi:hypothetical protein
VSTNFVRGRRTRIRGLPQSPAVIRSVPAPFVRGVNTEKPSWQLDPQETPAATDLIFPKGTAVGRGVYIGYGAAVLANPLLSAMAADLPSYGNAGGVQPNPVTVGTDSLYNIALIRPSPSPRGIIGVPNGGPFLAREVYKGEFLLCSQEGTYPIVRFAGAPEGSLTDNSNSAGTVFSVAGANSLTGAGTTFTTQARVGTYINYGFLGQSSLVIYVAGNTNLALDAPVPLTYAGVSWSSGAGTRLGVLGLCIPVHTSGVATMTVGSTTVTAIGASLNSASPAVYNGRPRVGDGIGIKGNYTRLDTVASIANDGQLAIAQNAYATFTNQPYYIYRNAPGREARYHQTRLYITGVDWDPTGVYYLPPNAPLGAHQNTDQPSGLVTTDYATSQILLKFDVPIAGAPGRNVALLSTPQGLLVLRSDNAYIVYGDPPTISIQLLAAGASCIDIRSACVGTRGEGAFWIGNNGIYRYTGGRVIDLTEGRRNREWRALVGGCSSAALFSAAVGDSHLFVAVQDSTTPANNRLWVYNLIADAWCSDFSSPSVTSLSSYKGVQKPYQLGDMVLCTVAAAMGSVTTTTAGDLINTIRDPSIGGVTASFSADLPESVVGPPDDLSRVTEIKVVYELTGGGSTITLSSNVDGGSYGTDATLAVNASGPQEVRIMPGSDVAAVPAGALGLLGRRHGHRLASTQWTTLRVHQIDLVVRPRRPRA